VSAMPGVPEIELLEYGLVSFTFKCLDAISLDFLHKVSHLVCPSVGATST